MVAAVAQKVGVELVVSGLSGFKSAMGQAKGALDSLRPKATLLERAFKSLGDMIKNFAQNIIQRILVIAFGVLVRDSIRKVISVIGEMISTVVELSDSFLRLEVRLNRLNLNQLTADGMSYNDALAKSVELTKEQLLWTLKLAGTTPYDSQDIAQAYTLARSYGFVDETARDLTERILDFSSGMGLGGEAIERIITNLGQMVQQGKITGTELRDLARGSFVPVNKILAIVAENMGMTVEELGKLRKAGTTDPQWFIQAFMEMVGTDFEGATQDMSTVFTAAMDNIRDIFLGNLTVMAANPVFKIIGERLSGLAEAFYQDGRYEKMVAIFDRIGKALASIVSRIFGLLPSSGEIADTLLNMFDKIATWLETNQDSIVNWVQSALEFMERLAETIKNDVVPWIKNELLPAIVRFGKWFEENKTTIMIVLGLIIGSFLLWEAAVIAVRIALGLLIATITIPLKLIGILISGILLLWGSLTIAINGFYAFIIITIAKLISNIRDRFDGFDWKTLGRNIIIGIVNGINSMSEFLLNTVRGLAQSALNIWNQIFTMHSPSVKMYKVGVNITKGLAKGITSGAKAVLGVTGALAESVSKTISGISSAGSSSGGFGVTTSKGANKYLSNIGEVMRSKLDVTTGKDPCAPGTAAGCAAAKMDSALKGIGSALISTVEKVGERIGHEMGSAARSFFEYSRSQSKGSSKTTTMNTNNTTTTTTTTNQTYNYRQPTQNNTGDAMNYWI